jgi:trehalose synthase
MVHARSAALDEEGRSVDDGGDTPETATTSGAEHAARGQPPVEVCIVTHLQEVHVGAQPLARFRPVVGDERVREAEEVAAATAGRLAGRVVWNVNSTARGGGVAEMLPSLLAYSRGAGVDTRWLVISGNDAFFHITKRLHHALHGSAGDGSPLGPAERAAYEAVLAANAAELLALVRPRDIVLLHDPQTAGLAPLLARAGALVIWRSHIGHDQPGEEVARGWDFLAPYFADVRAFVFSRSAYIPAGLDGARTVVIPPSLDPFTPKNQELDEATVRAMLVQTGLVEGPSGDGETTFLRSDGSPGRVDRAADVVRLGRAPAWGTPLVVQVSRWDRLKDHLGVMQGFAAMLTEGGDPVGADLVLAGPSVHAVADDPEGASVCDELLAAWRELPHAHRGRVHLASLPMEDAEENAAIVNALQRHAAVVVQKSLHEGFGLTVTEAMWKARPVVASAVGGIQDQIVDGVHGLLLHDPHDLPALGAALRRVLSDAELAAKLGASAQQRVRDEYLGIRHLLQYAALLAQIDV